MRALALFFVLLFALAGGVLADTKLQWGTSSGLGLAIPDDNLDGVTYTVNVDQHFTIDDLNVRVNIDHNRVGDLKVTIEGPDGTVVTLWDYNCSTDNRLNVLFDDQSSLVECGEQDVGKAGQPAGIGRKLNNFSSKDAFGEWTFTFIDRANLFEGEVWIALLLFKEDYNTPRIEALQTDVTAVSTDVDMIKTDLGMVKTDVAMIKTDVATANGRLVELQTSVDAVQADVAVANGRLDTLQSSVDDVQATVDDVGVRVDGVQTSVDQMQSDLTALQDHVDRIELQQIEKALWHREAIVEYSIPNALGGKLDDVRTVVLDAIAVIDGVGEATGMAATFVGYGDTQYGLGNYKDAFQFYSGAYCIAARPAHQVDRCFE